MNIDQSPLSQLINQSMIKTKSIIQSIYLSIDRSIDRINQSISQSMKRSVNQLISGKYFVALVSGHGLNTLETFRTTITGYAD